MKAQDLIAKKRDGKQLSAEEIRSFIGSVTSGAWADYQISAFLMACLTRGLNPVEQTHLTREMLESGKRLDFSDLGKPVADKHSTGGVGDKTSLLIAPLAAACGLAVPMISGRGLGHTGGTLDKLEAIKGYNVNLTLREFRRVIKKCGFSMIGQTAEIAPADKKLYALRDATATVNSIPLIVASIMSKKLAEGLDALILDVKAGSGAFMKTRAQAKELAAALVQTGNSCGVKTEAVISDMSEPLGRFSGNALEVFECVKILRGESDDLMMPTLALAAKLTAKMLVLTDVCQSEKAAGEKIRQALDSGSALEFFRHNITLQQGDASICDRPEKLLKKNLKKIEIKSARAGTIRSIDTLVIGEAIVEIGGGRLKIEDQINHSVGFECIGKIGAKTCKNDVVGILHLNGLKNTEQIVSRVQQAFRIV